jgi:hypothetical protein
MSLDLDDGYTGKSLKLLKGRIREKRGRKLVQKVSPSKEFVGNLILHGHAGAPL